MKLTIKKDALPLLIAVTLMSISVLIALFTNYTLNFKHYIGFALVCISCLSYFIKKDLYIYIFGVTLILGTTTLINIFYATFVIGIGFIKINPIFFILLALFIAFNKNLLQHIFPAKEPTAISIAEQKEEREKRIKNFEQNLQAKSVMELKRIAAEDSDYVEEAKIASRNILQHSKKS